MPPSSAPSAPTPVVRPPPGSVRAGEGEAPGALGAQFHWPVGGSEAARASPDVPRGWYVAVGFGEAYEPRPGRPAIHTGLDLNKTSGGDSDLGETVYACSDGVVSASGAYRVWGQIVVIQHVLSDGRSVWSQYAHLDRRDVAAGQTVRRGDPVGTIGKGEAARFAAHLHFELRLTDLKPSHWPGPDRTAVLRDYVDPAVVFRRGGVPRDTTASTNIEDVVPAPPTRAAARRARRRGVGATPRGKGLAVDRLWEIEAGDPGAIARRAVVMDVDFVIVRLGFAGNASCGEPQFGRIGAACDALAGAGIDAWGWSGATGRDVDAEAAMIDDVWRRIPLAGWVVEPVAAFPAAAAAAWVERARRLGVARLAVALRTTDLRHEPGAAGMRAPGPTWLAAFAPRVDALMPVVGRIGEMGLAVAALVGLDRPIVPWFDARASDRLAAGDRHAPPHIAAAPSGIAAGGTAPPGIGGAVGPEADTVGGTVSAFIDLARTGGRPAAVLATWDHCQLSVDGDRALRAWARYPWPRAVGRIGSASPGAGPIRSEAGRSLEASATDVVLAPRSTRAPTRQGDAR